MARWDFIFIDFITSEMKLFSINVVGFCGDYSAVLNRTHQNCPGNQDSDTERKELQGRAAMFFGIGTQLFVKSLNHVYLRPLKII